MAGTKHTSAPVDERARSRGLPAPTIKELGLAHITDLHNATTEQHVLGGDVTVDDGRPVVVKVLRQQGGLGEGRARATHQQVAMHVPTTHGIRRGTHQ